MMAAARNAFAMMKHFRKFRQTHVVVNFLVDNGVRNGELGPFAKQLLFCLMKTLREGTCVCDDCCSKKGESERCFAQLRDKYAPPIEETRFGGVFTAEANGKAAGADAQFHLNVMFKDPVFVDPARRKDGKRRNNKKQKGCAKGKRSSHLLSMLLTRRLRHKAKLSDPRDTFHVWSDGDTMYSGDDVSMLLSRMRNNVDYAAICGCVCPVWSINPLVMAERHEYLLHRGWGSRMSATSTR